MIAERGGTARSGRHLIGHQHPRNCEIGLHTLGKRRDGSLELHWVRVVVDVVVGAEVVA